MHIEASKESMVQKDYVENPAWNAFFSKFPYEATKEEKKEIINHFIEHLSHLIHRQMQRMIDTYKKMDRW